MQANGLGKAFDAADGTTMEIIRSISFSLNRGEIVSIVGPSGCGKTTLLNLLCGLLPPSQRLRPLARSEPRGAPRDWAICCKKICCFPGEPPCRMSCSGLQVKGHGEGRAPGTRDGLLDQLGLGKFRRSLSFDALRRHAPTCRAGTHDGAGPGSVTARRAVFSARFPDKNSYRA